MPSALPQTRQPNCGAQQYRPPRLSDEANQRTVAKEKKSKSVQHKPYICTLYRDIAGKHTVDSLEGERIHRVRVRVFPLPLVQNCIYFCILPLSRAAPVKGKTKWGELAHRVLTAKKHIPPLFAVQRQPSAKFALE
jgi:hypothetical protein